jgi:hypothetical protein
MMSMKSSGVLPFKTAEVTGVVEMKPIKPVPELVEVVV